MDELPPDKVVDRPVTREEIAPQTPEARALAGNPEDGRGRPVWRVTKRVVLGVYKDGFIHAGNIAYLTILTLFPFFIVAAAVAELFGRSADTAHVVSSFLRTLPPSVSELLAPPIAAVLAHRTGNLLWLGGLVGLWTVGSYIETIRDILRRAYGTTGSRSFFHYRLGSVLIILVSLLLALITFVVQGVLVGVEQFIYRLLPWAQEVGGWLRLSRLVPAAIMFLALYGLLYSLTPSKYRYGHYRKWPGALLITLWWTGTTALLPQVLAQLGGYDLTYGSLAGVIIALFFFWLVGLGLVVGAHLNAALAETPQAEVRDGPERG